MVDVKKTLNATDVRKHWEQFNDDIIKDGPRFVKSNRDTWAALSSDHLKVAFSHFSFAINYLQEEDGTVTATLDDFGLVENGDNKEVLDLIVDELIEYANEYYENFNLYFNSSNRRDHFPYIMNVLAQDNNDDVKGLITCQAG